MNPSSGLRYMASASGTEMKQVSPGLRGSEPVASFLQGSLVWITDYEELIDGRWHTFMAIHPRKIGHSSGNALSAKAFNFATIQLFDRVRFRNSSYPRLS